MNSNVAQRRVVLVRTRSWMCALPAAAVVETMRALPVVPVAHAPRFVRGLSIVRGASIPVVSLAVLLGDEGGARGGRFVVLRSGPRHVALEVDDVVGVPHLDIAALEQAPPLLTGALADHVEQIGVLDGHTLAALTPARLLSEETWQALAEQGVR